MRSTAFRTTRSARSAAAATALVAALALSACGSDSGDSGDAGSTGSSSQAADGGSDSGSDAKAGESIDGAELGEKVIAAMEEAGSGKVSMSSAGSTSTGVFEIEDGKFEQQMTTEMQGQELEVISAGGLIYIKGMPGQSKPWIKIDPNGTDPMSQMMGSMTGSFDLSDPRSMVKALEGTTATVVSSDGDGTTYEMSVKAADLLGELGAALGDAEVKVTYTLDGEDRPVKSVSSIQGQETTLTYSDWGADVSVDAPPADQVGTFSIPTT